MCSLARPSQILDLLDVKVKHLRCKQTKTGDSGTNLSSTEVTQFFRILTETVATVRMTDGLHKRGC